MMKGTIRKWSKLLALGGLISIFSLLVTVPAQAVSITFNLDQGGIVEYLGGVNPFTTTNGSVASVTGGSTTQSITNGTINLATGNYTGFNIVTGTGFITEFDELGFVEIVGDIGLGSGIEVLLTGEFIGKSYFNCCTTGGSSTFNGSLSIYTVNSDLAGLLGFNPPPLGGSIAQFEIQLNPAPSGPGAAFMGIQGGGQVFVADSPLSVPEPSTFLLLSGALVGLGLLRRREKQNSYSGEVNEY